MEDAKTMDIHFNIMKVKFETLDALTNDLFKSKPIRTLNIFINLDNLFSRLKNDKINQEFQACGAGASKQFISNVFNLIAHYRQWAVRKKTHVKVYAYYTSSEGAFENRVHNKKYREYYCKKCDLAASNYFYINTCINESYNSFKTISKYIDGIYLIDSRLAEPAAIPYLIQTEVRDADWNFIVSRDEYDLQYALMEKFSVIYPRGFESEVITENTLWNFISRRESISIPYPERLPSELYLLAYAVTGDKRRSVPKLKRMGWRTLFDILMELSNGFTDASFVSLTNKFVEYLNDHHFKSNELNDNLMCLGAKMNVQYMSIAIKEFIKAQIIDVPDYENLYELNRNPAMFLNFPLNLKFLADGGEEFKDKQVKNPFSKG